MGKGSFIYHSHCCEKEWLFMLLGDGSAEIDEVESKVGVGGL